MKKIIVTAGLTVALLASSSVATHQYFKVEQLQDKIIVNEHLVEMQQGALTSLSEKNIKSETALNNYAELNEQLDMKNSEVTKKIEELKAKYLKTSNDLKTTTESLKATTESLNIQKQTNTELREHSRQVKVTQQKDVQAKSISTKSTNVSSVSRGTSIVKRTINVTATAYTAFCAGCSGVTATGIDLRKNPNLKVIAVDPNVIPLGSKVFVEGYGYAIAGDTGGAIKGHKIDLFIPNEKTAFNYGRKHNISVQIISKK